jgi:hypothetical protein
VALSGGSFAISGATFPITLNPGASVVLQVKFDPTVTGDAVGDITISSNSANGGSTTIPLSGTGIAPAAPQLTLSAGNLAFGNVALNSTSAKNVTLTSSGTTALTVNSVTLAGAGFSMSGPAFPLVLKPGQSMSIQVSFDPRSAGPASGTIQVSSDSSMGTTSVVVLSGTGASAQLTASANALPFGNVTLHTTSTQTLTLVSTGILPVSVNSITLSGAGFSMAAPALPAVLNAGQTSNLQVSFDPAVTGAASGTITISSNSTSGGTIVVALSGSGTTAAVPQLTLSTGALAFGNVALNTTSSRTLTLTSAGTAALKVNSASVAGAGFAVTGGPFPATLNPGQSITLQVDFDPKSAGVANGILTILSNSSSGSSSTVSLSGTGMSSSTPQLTVSPGALAFGNVLVNSSSNLSLTLRSSGTSALTVNSVTLAGAGFTLSGVTFPATLNPGQSVSLQVGFAPAATGAASGTITISSDSSSGGTNVVTVSGTGTAPQLTVSAASLGFGNVTLNFTSTKALTLTSTGTAPLTVNSATLTGAGFSKAGGAFPTALNPGQSVTIQVSFDPTVAGVASGRLTIASDSFGGGTATVSLSGTGINSANPVLTLSATTLDFGDDPVGTRATLQLTISSTGTSPVTVSSAGVTGSGFSFSGNAFPVTLNPNIAVSIQVQFDPSTAGPASGTLTFASNSSTGSTSVVNLTGKGTTVQHQVTLNWTAPANSPVPVTGYNVYRATGTPSAFQILNTSSISQTTYTDSAVTSGTAYSYYVTSVDAAGAESAPSSEVMVTIP